MCTSQFVELQEQLSAYSKDLRSVQLKLTSAQRESRANQVTAQHVDSLPEDVRTYRAVGKAFLLEPKTEVQSRLEKEHSSLIKTQRDLSDRREYLERRISSTQTNLRDLTAGA